MIGVVIPYYQRTPGLLTRALQSVAGQSGPAYRVVVVDDGSPAPASAELATLPAAFTDLVCVLRRPNGGPGAARNTALDSLPAEVDAVAFLDSDDAWTTGHLARAASALAAGADFYFADHQREEDPQTRFAQCDFRPTGQAVAGEDGLVWCDAEMVSRAIVTRSPVGTSTVVIRRSTIGATRFRPGFRTAGEDSIFWLEVLPRARPVCSLSCEARYGRGVSVFNHRSWGEVCGLRTTLDEMRAQRHLQRHFALDADLIGHARSQCRRLDAAFCANLLACLRRGRWPALAPALQYFARRPAALLDLPAALSRAVRSRAAAPA